jgi:H+/Na+-translocating ferredoxin:NAD+ oxidoreductase subunit C
MMKTFKGGMHTNDNKLTRNYPIERMPMPKLLFIPLNQHIGKLAKPIVKVGDHVKKGQIIGEADGFVSAHVIASTSGKIKTIGRHPHPNGDKEMTITLEPDGKDEWLEGLNIKEEHCDAVTPEMILERVKRGGVVGMGGAGFPTHIKLSPPKDKKIDTIILNGAECEPFLTADHRLMLEYAIEVTKGVAIVKKIFGKDTDVYIGIENNKPDAIEMMETFSQRFGFKIVPLKTKYPQGGEKTLIKTITGREVKEKQLPFDVGCLVINVATAFSIFYAVCKNRPTVERVVTVSGMAINDIKNVMALVGTKFSDIADFCGHPKDDLNQVIAGGPMMGKAQYTLDVPVIKTTSGILFINNERLRKTKETPCIRCGRCLDVCPQREDPRMLANLAEKNEIGKSEKNGLSQCMECGSCSYVCPSGRSIVHWVRYAKALNSLTKKSKN